ncbi:MAG: hypothetical protein IPQ19_04515 [Bacteroidetes bacterium]|nr:hypothetical protein [Bacteroidota bacterium]
MREKINELIPKAMEAITSSKIADKDGNVKKEFKGYIASIGASIIFLAYCHFGILPKFIRQKADSFKVLDAILLLIKQNGNNEKTY